MSSDFGSGFDASANQATRDRRQELGRSAVTALHSLLRNARVHSEENAVFGAPLAQLGAALAELIATDGSFDLQLTGDALYVNRQAVRLDTSFSTVVAFVRSELGARGIQGFTARALPAESELRALVKLFTPAAPANLGPQGDPAAPLVALQLRIGDEAGSTTWTRSQDTRLVDAYSHAVFFVARTLQQLRSGGQPLPLWAASRVVQDLVDLQDGTPLRFLQLARCKAGGDSYYGFHAANVAVLAIAFGARLGMTRRRRHDLGMAALFHDIGVAAIPANVLSKEDVYTEREMAAMNVTPLFAARAILRDREVHGAALERTRAVYDCHRDVSGPRAEPDRPVSLIGQMLGICEAWDALTTTRPHRKAFTRHEAQRMLETELAHRFDPAVVEKFLAAIEPLLRD